MLPLDKALEKLHFQPTVTPRPALGEWKRKEKMKGRKEL